MIYILAKMTVEDLPKFFSAYSSIGAVQRRKHACRHSELVRVSDQKNQVVLLLARESRAAYDGFLKDPTVRETLQASGTLGAPELTFLDKIGEFQD